MPNLNTNALSLPYGVGGAKANKQKKAKILTHSKEDIKIPYGI
jgi:hypothetical protein